MIIAARSLKLRQGSNEIAVPVRIFAPQDDDNQWSCAYEIDWPEGTRKSAGHGADSVQALLLALEMIGSEIYTSDYHKSGCLFFEAVGCGYGFPVPTNLRDLLDGDDAEYL